MLVSGSVLGDSLINLDSSVNGGGADTIRIQNAVDIVGVQSSTIKGKGGQDQITISGELGASARIEGNAGADLITLNGAFAADNGFVGAGSGNDTILVTGNNLNASAATVQGGGGSDFIDLGANAGGLGYLGTGLMVYGGAGQDTIDIGGAATGTIVGAAATGVVAFGSLTDSSLDAIDTVTGVAGYSGINFALDTAAGITSFTIGAFTDSDLTTPSITAGICSGATWESADSSVTARVTQLDELLTTKGTLVGFDANGTEYIFVQGGSSGTADDAVIEISDTGGTFNTATDYRFALPSTNASVVLEQPSLPGKAFFCAFLPPIGIRAEQITHDELRTTKSTEPSTLQPIIVSALPSTDTSVVSRASSLPFQGRLFLQGH